MDSHKQALNSPFQGALTFTIVLRIPADRMPRPLRSISSQKTASTLFSFDYEHLFHFAPLHYNSADAKHNQTSTLRGARH